MNDQKVKQSLENFENAIISLEEAVEKEELSDLELAGAIQNFEFCYELAWKTLQKLGGQQGRKIVSPRDAFQFAREAGYLQDERLWLDMIEDRNETVHTYDHATAQKIYKAVKERYFQAFLDLFKKLSTL